MPSRRRPNKQPSAPKRCTTRTRPSPRSTSRIHIPQSRTPDHYALEILAMVLGDGESSRLYQTLVKRERDLPGHRRRHRRSPWSGPVLRVGRDGERPSAQRGADDRPRGARVDRQRRRDRDASSRRQRTESSAAFVFGLQSNMARSQHLAEFELYWGDANLLKLELDHYLAVSNEDIKRVAGTYFDATNRTVLDVLPGRPRPGLGGERMTWLRIRLASALFATDLLAVCAKGRRAPRPQPPGKGQAGRQRDTASAPGEARTCRFRRSTVAELSNGLQVNTIVTDQLPVVYATLVIRSGARVGPGEAPGLSRARRPDAQGGHQRSAPARKSPRKSNSSAPISGRARTRRTPTSGYGRWPDSSTSPWRFSPRSRAAVRSATASSEAQAPRTRSPGALGTRAPVHRATHLLSDPLRRAPLRHGRYDPASGEASPPPGSDALARAALRRQERVPRGRGRRRPRAGRRVAQKTLGRWKAGKRAAPVYASPRARPTASILVVDRPGSVQSVIYIGNLAIARANREWIPLIVANQVLGGSAASRLFMDLREKRSLTYGAYSAIGERVDIGPFVAYCVGANRGDDRSDRRASSSISSASTKSRRTGEELDQCEALPERFVPAQGRHPGQALRSSSSELRTYGLPERLLGPLPPVDSRRRAHRRRTTWPEATSGPRRPSVVIVGQAADFAQSLERFGPVTVVSPGRRAESQVRRQAQNAARRVRRAVPSSKVATCAESSVTSVTNRPRRSCSMGSGAWSTEAMIRRG